jgi:hypothetical protein
MRNGIDAVAAERATAREPPKPQPDAAAGPVKGDGFGHVVGARRVKPAAAGK